MKESIQENNSFSIKTAQDKSAKLVQRVTLF